MPLMKIYSIPGYSFYNQKWSSWFQVSVFTHFCFCAFWSSTPMQLLCLFLCHLIPCFCADLVACFWWTYSLHFFQALSSVECFGLPSSCGGSPEFTFSPGPWIVWASVCLFNTLYPHYGFHVSFTLCRFLCSCFLYLHCSHLSSYYDQIHCHSIWPILATRPLFFCLWESSSLESHQRLISFLLLTVLITFATWRHKHRLIKVSVVLVGFGVPE